MTGIDSLARRFSRLGPVARWAALLAAWTVSRTWLLVIGLVPLSFYPGGTRAFDDLSVYANWVPLISGGVLPTDDMWQYPPASAFFFGVGAWGDAVIVLQTAIIGLDLLLTCVLARRSMTAGWAWVAAGLLIGPVLVSRFDIVPTLFAVLAVLSAGRPVRVGAWAAIGAAMKLWPALLLAIVPRREAGRALAAFAVVSASVLGATALVFDELSGFLGGQGSRGLQVEAVAALPFMLGKAAGADVDVAYRYGSMEVTSAGAGLAAGLVVIGLLAALAWLAGCWWRGILAEHEPADVAFTVILISVVFSRVFSPQYSVWLLGLGALCLASPRSAVKGPVLLIGVAAGLAQMLYPSGYGEFLTGDLGMNAVQAVRIGLVVAAAAVALVRISRPAAQRRGPVERSLAERSSSPIGA